MAALLRGLTQNPVILKELRGRMRGRRAFVVLTVYLLLLSGFSLLVYAAASASADSPVGGGSTNAVGKSVFTGIVAVELFLACFITPAFTAAGISGERERQTFDLLRTTLLRAPALIGGKVLSALAYVLLLIFAAVPLQSMAFLLGGIGPEEVAISLWLLVVSALAFGMLGIYVSAVAPTTLRASVATYGMLFTIMIGIPVLMLLGLAVLSALYYAPSAVGGLSMDAAITYLTLLLVSLNPILAAALTEEYLITEHTAFFFTTSSYGGHSLPMVSPWIPFTIIYLLASVLLYVLAVRRVRRMDR
jgi:ABC-2 type transport system permease protein